RGRERLRLGHAAQARPDRSQGAAAAARLAREDVMMSRELNGIGMTSARTRERLVERLRAEGIDHEAVLERIRTVPRHLFVDEALASRASEDTALPIGDGQPISQQYTVALMPVPLITTL